MKPGANWILQGPLQSLLAVSVAVSELKPQQNKPMPTLSKAEYRLWVRRSGYLTMLFAGLIVLLKLYASIETNAASMLASLMDAVLDVLVSGLNFAVLSYALKPADDDHRFGHGKAEAVMALSQAAFLTGVALLLIYQGFSRIYAPEPIAAIGLGIWLTIVCSGLTLLLVLLQQLIIRKTGSLAVQADLAHYRSDLLLNAAVLLALWLVANSLIWADALISCLIALALIWNGWQLARQSLAHLLDQELPDLQRQQIVDELKLLQQVLAVDELRTRQAGPRVFIQLRLVLDNQLTLQQAHDIVDLAECRLARLFHDAEVIIHADPQSEVPSPEYPFR